MQKILCLGCSTSKTRWNMETLIDAYDEWLHWPDFNVPTPHTYLCLLHLSRAWEGVEIRNQQYKEVNSGNR